TALDNLVIDDLLPAGLEVENARLATTADARQLDTVVAPREAPFSPARIDIRDDRVIIVGSLPATRAAKFTYLARATTPGVFTIPPVRAECMYDIGIHSLNGAGQTLRILPI